jgi:hypothetical protein
MTAPATYGNGLLSPILEAAPLSPILEAAAPNRTCPGTR